MIEGGPGAMITEIGIQAGEIWRCLDENWGNCSFECLASHTGTSRELLLMALGWLAREGYILVKKQGEDFSVSIHDRSKTASNSPA